MNNRQNGLDDRQRVEAERARIKAAWPDEFGDGRRRALARDPLYPPGFHDWPLGRRNAWFCGFNVGLIERRRTEGGRR